MTAPAERNVAIFEDNQSYVKSIGQLLRLYNYNLAVIACTVEEAEDAIRQLEPRQVRAALVDGNLHPDDVSGNDGKRIIETIKSIAPSVVTVGHSASREVSGAHQNCSKVNGPQELIKTLDRIFNP
jgi:DNA-binding NtrC family response regulator